MFMHKSKKGFTIVELVIVIAVIAILAAVLIPTFSNLVKKANMSADQQAVRQMNTVLATYVDGSVKNVADAVAALDKENIDLDNYKALTKDHFFYFVVDAKGTPKVIYADKTGKIIAPADVELSANAQWMSLSGMVPMSDDYTVNNGAVTVDNGAELAHLMEQVKNNKETVKTVTLSGNVDLQGAAVDFGTVTDNVTITGAAGTVLSGLRADDNTYAPTTGEFAGDKYGYGLFGNIEKDAVVTIENITISGLSVGNSLVNHGSGANTTGLIAGYVKGKLIMNNVTIDNCDVNGYQKVGGLVGQLLGTVELNKVKVTNTTVNGYTEVAKIAGIIGDKGNLTATDCDFAGITVNGLNKDSVKKSDITSSEQTIVGLDSNTYNLAGPDIFGSATNDWAWYWTGNYFDVTVPAGTFEGTHYMSTTSKNVINGVPAN
ncbi:MAG: type II secretion system protein [Clostridia bacterium]|nr:type II secretion system protein [Clostridia bacterium]